MSTISLLFPHQLFEKNPALKTGQPVWMLEENLFFKQYNFHKQKLVFHRASMKAYASFLQHHGYTVTYIEAHERNADVRNLLPYLKEQGITEIQYSDVTDYWLQQRLLATAKRLNLTLVVCDSPLFLLTSEQIDVYFKNKKRFYQTDFYTQQRKYFKILIDVELQPLGGKWTFD